MANKCFRGDALYREIYSKTWALILSVWVLKREKERFWNDDPDFPFIGPSWREISSVYASLALKSIDMMQVTWVRKNLLTERNRLWKSNNIKSMLTSVFVFLHLIMCSQWKRKRKAMLCLDISSCAKVNKLN